MKNVYKFICFALAAVLLLTTLAGCNGESVETQTDTEKISNLVLSEYVIVYSESIKYEHEASAAVKMKKDITDKFGVTLKMATDYIEKGETYDSSSKQILVGHTEYPQSKTAAEEVTREDFLIRKDGEKIVLIGGCEETLGECIEYFLKNYIDTEDGNLILKTQEQYLKKHEYEHAETNVRVMNLNLWYAYNTDMNYQGVREPAVAGCISEQAPDSLGVNECEPFWRQRLDIVLGAKGYARAQQLQTPENTSKNYIYYNKATTELVEGGTMWLSETPDKPSKGFGSQFYISASWAIFKNIGTGAEYVHVNTHLDVNSEQIRMKEIDVLMRKVKEFTDAGYYVMLTGDFNSVPTSPIYAYVTERMSDARTDAKDSSTMGTFNGYGDPEFYPNVNRIDFCFYYGDVIIEKFNVIDKYKDAYMSDHNAVVTDICMYKR